MIKKIAIFFIVLGLLLSAIFLLRYEIFDMYFRCKYKSEISKIDSILKYLKNGSFKYIDSPLIINKEYFWKLLQRPGEIEGMQLFLNKANCLNYKIHKVHYENIDNKQKITFRIYFKNKIGLGIWIIFNKKDNDWLIRKIYFLELDETFDDLIRSIED